jgi:radical SAM superfamily enzyme YgiQ (UPF0313 family)
MHNAIILTDYTDSVFLTRPLGPYKIAHELRKLNVDTIVINHIHMWNQDELHEFINSLINSKTLFVGVNNMYYKNADDVDFYAPEHITLKPAYKGQVLPHGKEASDRFVKFIKSKELPLILGGPTAIDQQHNAVFDYLLQGFADTSIEGFVNHLKSGTQIPNSYRSVFGPVVVQDTNEIAGWDFSNSTMQWQDKDVILPNETMSIEIARGCIFKCAFCYYPLIGKKKFDYIRQFDIIKQEMIDNWKRFGVTRYYFSDETFNDSIFKLEQMEKLASELPFKLEYFAYLRLDLIIKHPETIGMLVRSGLRATHFGIETFHPTAGKAIGKKFKPDQVIQVLKQLKEISNGEINLHASFIVGLPGESKEHILKIYNMLKTKELPLDSFVYFPLCIGHTSYFSKNYENYGYHKMTGDAADQYVQKYAELIPWKSDVMTCLEAVDFAKELDQEGFAFKQIGGLASFEIAGLGFDQDFYLNKKYSEIDWSAIVLRKIDRFNEYKSKLKSFAITNH